MAKEIERKFLVRDASILDGITGKLLVQGYLAAGAITTRVRIAGDAAFLTIKGPPTGIACDEWEYAIPVQDAHEMLALPDVSSIAKTRYEISVGEHVFEVDVFAGRHAGLILAEVELGSVDEAVILPAWLGAEVSGDRRYTNAYLATTSH